MIQNAEWRRIVFLSSASSTRTTILPLKIGNVFLMKLDQGMLQKHSMWNLWQYTVDLIFEFHQYERLYLKKNPGISFKTYFM